MTGSAVDDSVAAAAGRDLAAYYARRATEYDRVYAKPERQADLRAIEAWLPSAFAGRRVLEVACGTGWWTRHGASGALDWLATDVNAEVLAVARAKPMPSLVRFALADAWRLDAPEIRDAAPFDAAFAGFWWSHVPRARLGDWLDALRARLAPGARLVVVDNRFVEGSIQPIARRDAFGDTFQRRRLDDGSVHEVMKNFPDESEVRATFGVRAASLDWIEHPYYWIADATLA